MTAGTVNGTGPIRTPATGRTVGARWIVQDPARNEWLALEQANVAGAMIWVVAGHHAERVQAERAAGFHDSPAVRWLLHDAELGWRRRSGKGWMHAPSAITQYDRAEAEAIAAAEPGLQLLVVRANGLITCPDVEAGS